VGAQLISRLTHHAQEILNLKKRLNEIYMKHTGQLLQKIEEALERDLFMTAETAKDFGLVDKVIDRRPEIPPLAVVPWTDIDGWREAGMMKRETLAIADIYVPVKRRATRDQKRVDEIATSMLDKGQQAPILVRADGARFVLVEGLHRLEAAKALGEKTIFCFLVDARRH
jgi:sulfiredoxin